MKIIILDFSTSEVYIFDYNNNIYDNAEDFFENDFCKENNIKEKNCQYMVVENLNIKII